MSFDTSATSKSKSNIVVSPRPSPDVYRARFVGEPITALPTPTLLIDRARLSYNCQQMRNAVERLQCKYSAHIKTLKTAESTAAQVDGMPDKAVIVSTLAEAWGVVQSGLIKHGSVKNILYGIPLGSHKLNELFALRSAVRALADDADVSVMVDHADQATALHNAFKQSSTTKKPLDVYIKIDCGYRRAGLSPTSAPLTGLIESLCKASPYVRIYGVYTHAGFSYGSKSLTDASSYLSGEVKSVNDAAQLVNNIVEQFVPATGDQRPITRSPLVLSIGSTPTVHAAVGGDAVSKLKAQLCGDLELHAGNYPVLDLQQLATNAIPDAHKPAIERCALSVLVTIISSYPGRASHDGEVQHAHKDGRAHAGDEAMCDAGGIAFSKDTGPIPGHGHVVWPSHYVGWQLGRVSQEHGVLTLRNGSQKDWLKEWGYNSDVNDETSAKAQATVLSSAQSPLAARIGDKLRIVPQHACMTAAAHEYFLIYDSSLNEDVPTIQDVWIPWKGW